MMAESAQVTIARVWPDHVGHKTRGKHPRWDTELGIVCACDEVLGWPEDEPHETLSQKLKREAQEQTAAARAKETPRGNDYTGRSVTGAFGTYSKQDNESTTPEPSTKVAPDADHEESTVDADVVGEPEWEPLPEEIEPPDDEPEPEELITDGEVQALFEPAAEAPAEVLVDLPPWPDGERSDAAEIADGSQEEYGIPPGSEVVVRHEVGRESVPYAGTPIFPTPDQELDPLNGRLAPLDPTMTYTPQDVELKIVEILGQLEKSEIYLRQQVAREHQATHNYTMRYNLAIAQSDARAQDQRNAEAVIATEREVFEMNQAKMLTKCLRDSQHNLRSQLSGFQSVARSLAVSLTNSLDARQGPSGIPPEPPRAPWER